MGVRRGNDGVHARPREGHHKDDHGSGEADGRFGGWAGGGVPAHGGGIHRPHRQVHDHHDLRHRDERPRGAERERGAPERGLDERDERSDVLPRSAVQRGRERGNGDPRVLPSRKVARHREGGQRAGQHDLSAHRRAAGQRDRAAAAAGRGGRRLHCAGGASLLFWTIRCSYPATG